MQSHRFTAGVRSGLTIALCLLAYARPALPAAARVPAARATRIHFRTGALSTQTRGSLASGRSQALFVLKAKAGDRMIVNIISLTSGFATGGEVKYPSGKQTGHHGGVIFSGDLTESGDYTIRVTRNLMAGERNSGAFLLEVVILPSSLKNETDL